MVGMNELLTTIPEVEANLENAKEAVIQKIRTERITKDRVLFNYESAKRLATITTLEKIFLTISISSKCQT